MNPDKSFMRLYELAELVLALGVLSVIVYVANR